MSSRHLALLGGILVSCGPWTPVGSSATGANALAASSSIPSASGAPSTSSRTLAVANGPLVRSNDYALTTRSERPALKLVPHSLPFFRPGPMAGEYLLTSGTSGSRIVSAAHPEGIALKEMAYRSAWSPSGARLAMTEESGELHVFDLEGKRLRTLTFNPCSGCMSPTAAYWNAEVAMPDETHVRWHDGCRLRQLDLADPASQPVDLGAKACVKMVLVDGDAGGTWVGGEVGQKAYGEGFWYARTFALDGATGSSHVVAESTDVGPFADIQLSPDGKRVCYMREGRKLACVSTDGKKTVEPMSEARCNRWFTFDSTSRRLLFQEEDSKDEASLFVADLDARTIRRVVRTSLRWSSFGFLTKDRVAVYGIGGAEAIDLAAGWSMILADGKTDEIGSVTPIPSDSSRFVLGKEVGAGRALYFGAFP